ncbi:hypothetical protein L7A00_001896 [Enterobacter cloacae]|uniref:hypothetical protein n=1 Tax=Enterobacter sichuanensis TaxID=2071710 RepID=UPI002A83110C|nr:hypothetical protein [Enterobacter sichuanensis]EKU3858225.1 hypothetical protein [Enterobacter cloacae]EKX9062179.1 hypothetical protein [Enterobacter cloacae]
MNSTAKSDEISVSPLPIDRPSRDGGVSPKLLEQLNAQKLDRILDSMGERTRQDEKPAERSTLEQGGSMTQSFQSFIKWVGLSLPIVAALVGTTVWINTTIDNKARENRLELKADLESAKVELKAEVIRTQGDIARLDDKIDRKMDKLSDQLTVINQEIRDNRK